MPKLYSDDDALQQLGALRAEQEKTAFWRRAWIGTVIVGIFVTLFYPGRR